MKQKQKQKQKQLVKVIGTSITGVEGGKMSTAIARGIAQLKRSQSLMGFIHQFLSERAISHYTLNQRGDGSWATSPMMYLNVQPMRVVSFHFLQFSLDNLGYHAKDLTAEELERDLKPLQKIIYGG